MDGERGFDHGVFVPLKLIFPEADIPCFQISLIKGLDPAQHIALGRALNFFSWFGKHILDDVSIEFSKYIFAVAIEAGREEKPCRWNLYACKIQEF